MSFFLRFVSIPEIIKYIAQYLGGLLAGTIKNPTSTEAKLLFEALDVLQKVIDQINTRRGIAKASTITDMRAENAFWNA